MNSSFLRHALGVLPMLTILGCATPASPPHVPAAPAPVRSPDPLPPSLPAKSSADAPALAPADEAAKEPPEPEGPSHAELVERFTADWRSLLAKRNGVSVDVVDRAVKVTETSLVPLGGGMSLVVTYDFTFGWLTVPVVDTMLVRGIPYPRPEWAGWSGWLTREQQEAIAADTSPTTMGLMRIARLPFGKRPAFRSRADVVAAMKGNTGARFDVDDFKVDVPSPLNQLKELTMTGLGSTGTDWCLHVEAKLVSGAIAREKTWCGGVSAR